METMLAPTNIKALRQNEATLRGAMRLLIETAEKEHRDLSDEEASIFASRKADLEKNSARLAVAEDRLDRERKDTSAIPVEGYDPLAVRRAASAVQRPSVANPRTYREMFGSNLSNDGWSSPGEFFSVLHSGRFDHRLRPAQMSASSMGEDVPSGGGFFVSEETTAQLLDASLESEIVRPRAKIEVMLSETKKISSFDASSDSGGILLGGISASWSPEATAANFQTPKTKLLQLTANKLFILVSISNELIQDGGQDFETMLTGALVRATGWFMDDAFLTGSGAGRPRGVLNDNALVTIAKESSQAAATLLYPNVCKMFGALHPSCVSHSCWVANSTVIPQLLAMQNVVKNVAGSENVGGSAVPVVSQNGDQMTLLTRPILFSEKLPQIGTVGDLILADFSQYSVGLRAGLSLEKSSHYGFASDTSIYRAILRVDGQGRWSRAFQPKNGSPTSWAVALATRA